MRTTNKTTPAGRASAPWTIDAAAVAVLAALTAGVYFGEVGPAVARHNDHEARLARVDAERARAAELAATAEQLRHQLAPAGAGGREPEFQLQPAGALNDRLATLTDLAVAHELQLDAVEPGKETPGPGHGTVDIRLAGRGGYRDVAAFIRDARGRVPDTGFTDLTLAAPANPAEPATFTVRLLWHTAGSVTGTAK